MAERVERVTTHIIPDDHRKVNLGDSTHEFNAIRSASLAADTAAITTVTGNLVGNVTGNVTGESTLLPTTAGPTSGALSVAMSGRLCIGVVDAVYTLPAPTAGVWYTIIVGVASAGTGLVVTATSTLINGHTTPVAGATTITDATNYTCSGASDVKGNLITIRSDGTKWYITAQTGTWAGS